MQAYCVKCRAKKEMKDAKSIIIAKFFICSLITRLFGYSLKTTLFVGAGLTQVGEFSFLLGLVGLETGLISGDFYSLILSSAILTILFTPIAFKLAELAYSRLSTSNRLSPLTQFGSDRALIDVKETLSNHVVICGHCRHHRRYMAPLELATLR